tara:strand:- start:170 stop:721 length:552 start_codon:yes stop_codon:yes gene_type:complete
VHNKKSLEQTIFSNFLLFDTNELKLSIDNSTSLYSIYSSDDDNKKIVAEFKNFFKFLPPKISKFEKNEKVLVFWVRKNSYFVLGEIDYDKFNQRFKKMSSITIQTGGWITFNLSGNSINPLLEKLISVDLDKLTTKTVIRTSINKINCFVLCNSQFQNYKILCPISFYESMKSRLVNLIRLIY